MKKNPCNEYWMVGPDGQDRITYDFVTEDGNTCSSCTVSLGDIDPMTGERLTDPELFREYNRMRNREVYYNVKNTRAPFTSKEEAYRRKEKERIICEFRRDYGYMPSAETVEYLLSERFGSRCHVSMSGQDYIADIADPGAEAAFMRCENEHEPDLLHDFVSSLTGRLRDVYEMMILEVAGVADRDRGAEIGERWGVRRAAISKDRKKLMRMIREYIEKGGE